MRINFRTSATKRWNGWDENWLLIAGEVSYEQGKHWVFRDPALTVGEARQIAPWLRRAASGSIPTSVPDAEGFVSPDLVFVEPNLAFSIAEQSDAFVRLRVHFSLESAPPWFDMEERANIWSFFVELTVRPGDLDEAAGEWERGLDLFPVRESG